MESQDIEFRELKGVLHFEPHYEVTLQGKKIGLVVLDPDQKDENNNVTNMEKLRLLSCIEMNCNYPIVSFSWTEHQSVE